MMRQKSSRWVTPAADVCTCGADPESGGRETSPRLGAGCFSAEETSFLNQ